MKKAKLFFSTLLMLLAISLSAQNLRVTGTVTDAATGEGIPFASVVVKGTMNGTSTDENGHYEISVPGNAELIFSAIGYLAQEIGVSNRALLNVALGQDTQLLDETIVVAYGTATKSSFTGSAAQVKAETIEKKISTNVTSALAGSAPGVQVITASGDPTGNKPTIRIRGVGSMSASNDPLVVVDGVPFEGAISDINPQDVESMSVLKDASASAIYGHRGANGVILITTKKGKAGEAQVKFDARFGVNSRLIPQYDVITDPAEYYETWYKKLYNMAFYSNGGDAAKAYETADKQLFDSGNGGLGYQVYTIPAGELFIGRDFKLNPKATLGYYNGAYYYTPDDWYKESFHNGYRQEYNASVSGSSNRFTYYASAGYLNDGGMVDNSNYKRYTARINAEYQAKDWLRVITNTTFSHSDSQIAQYSSTWGSSGSIFWTVNNMAPIYPLYVRKLDENGKPYIVTENGRIKYDANSTYTADGKSILRAGTSGNAVRDNVYNDEHQYADVLVGKWGLVATPIKGLTLSANIGVTADNTRYTYLGSKFGSSASTNGYAYVSQDRMFSVNNQYLAEYKFSVGRNNFDILLGYEKYARKSQYLQGSNDHLYDPFIGELANADGHANEYNTSYTNNYMTDGILGRVQYDFDGKYFLSASIRRDESSRFAKGHRWGTFGSLGGAWLITKEGFMQNVDWVDLLKLKVSYGVQGNDNLGSLYPYANQYTHSYNETTGEYSISLSTVGNENLTWETSKSLNAGLDFELFKGYLNGSAEVFSRTTSDLLYNLDVPYSSGNPKGYVPTNVGSINNFGFEINLDGSIIRTRNVQWNWNANFSHYKNTILSLHESVAKDGIKNTGRIFTVGGSLYDGYMYKYAGVDKETGKAQYYQKVYETNKETGEAYWTGEEEIVDSFSKLKMSTDHDDRYNIGSFLPKLFGGFGTSLNAYGFDLSVQLSYQLGGRYYDGTYQGYMHTQNNAGQNIHKDILKAWQKAGDETDVPRWDGNTEVSQTPIDRFVVSSDYLSLNNVTIGYSLPKSLVQKIGLTALRIYATGENLYVLSARKGLDPRYNMGIGSMTSGSGFANNSYGSMRNITGGISITF